MALEIGGGAHWGGQRGNAEGGAVSDGFGEWEAEISSVEGVEIQEGGKSSRDRQVVAGEQSSTGREGQ